MSIDAYGQTSGSNCDSSETIEATLTVNGTAHAGSFENAGGLHYFQIGLTSDIDLIIETRFTNNNLEYSLQLCDSNGNLIASDRNDDQNIWVPLISGTYYIVVGSSGVDQYQLRVIADVRIDTSLSDCEDLTTSFPDDPLYGCQWHLNNTGQWRFDGRRITAGEDINIEGVWNDEIFGNGINVALVDDGIDSDHEDLADNVNSALNHDYTGRNNVFDPFGHGTRTGGIIAAVGDNELGVRGVAPQAGIYAYNLLAGNNSNSANTADAMTRNRTTTAVSSNSWGILDVASLHSAGRTWEMAVETGIREGFGGKGVFYSWSAGNGHSNFDQANFQEYSNYYATTTVCSTDGFGRKSPFSEEGVNLWVCAPGTYITTTYNNDLYGFGSSGTSYSVPMVSGVAALMREVNSSLSWRDLKLILAASARKNDPTDPGWETVALKYGSETENYNYNPKYGFGVVDAGAAVEFAENWNRVSQMKTLMASSSNINMAIPDRTGGTDGVLVSKLTIPDTDSFFTEFVEIKLTFTHPFFPEVEIQITSPDGTVSQLSEEYIQGSLLTFILGGTLFYTNYTHRFGSAKHLGEDPAGEWSLKISDTRSSNTGTLHSWSIKVYGHRSDNTVPDFGSETITDKEYEIGVSITPETFPAATGGEGTLTYSMTPVLPDGLSFDSNTRVLSGTPTNVTSKTMYTYTATDEDGDIDDITFGITVGSDVPTFGNETITDKKYAEDIPIMPETLPVAMGGDGALRYSISPALPDGLSFDSNTRVLSGTPTTGASKTNYTYTATDEEGDNAELTFAITVEPDTSPTFSGQTITDKEYEIGVPITETLPEATGGNGTLLYFLTLPGLPVIASYLPDGLDLNENTRVLSGTPTTVTSKTAYTYTVYDEDGDTDEITFSITIGSDVPVFGSKTITDKEYVTGTAIAETLPVAVGGNGALTYSLTPDLPDGLDFDENTRVLSGTPTTAMSKTAYTYTVTDGEGDTAELTFGITVETDSMPTFGSEMIDDKEYVTGTAARETLPEATGGNGELTYTLIPPLPDGLRFNPVTRVLSGTPTTVTSKTTYTYTVTDEDGDTDDITFGITIEADSMPTFGSETIDDKEYVTGTAVTETLPEATGGNGALTYNLVPSFPPGLVFNADTREISGAPTTAETGTSYTYTARDKDGDTADLTFRLTVEADDMPDFGSKTITDKEYVTGTAVTETLPEAAGGNSPLTYSISPPLPAGLSFNSNTREISGAPTSAESGTYTYTARDKDGDTADLMFRLTVEADDMPDFGSKTITDKEYVTGIAVTETLPDATGGNGVLRYSLTPDLPTGLDFDADTREISGTPTSTSSGTYTYTVRDKDGDRFSLTFRITVEVDSTPDFGIETIDDKEYVTGTAITETLPSATGGNGALTYSLTPDLPTGLDFNADTREISGTPTAATSKTTYTYTVNDKDGDTAELRFGITIEADRMPEFGSETIDGKEYVTGTAITETLPSATGGNGALTYSLTPTLPSGLNFNASTRVLSGTPASASSGTYTYTVEDEDGDTAELTFGITVEADGTPSFGGERIDDKEYVADTAVTETLPVATGGNGALTYDLTPTLPVGLSFNTNTRVLSGTPASASSGTYTYTVGDEDGDTAELTFGITVETDSMPNFGGETIEDKEYVTGTAVTETLPEATGGNGALTYSLTPGLPAGLDFDASTREISGTPTTATPETTYTYTVTDKDGDTADLTFRITVEADSMPDFGGGTIDNKEYLTGTAITTETLPVAMGGNGVLRYSLTPVLPAGLTFSATARTISGTPRSASSDTYTYKVTDGDGDEADLMFRITVEIDSMPDFGGNTTTDKEYVEGTAVTETLPAARGGNSPLTYSLTPGLPAGLEFDPVTRRISGTPDTVTSSANYTYAVMDADGDVAELMFSITVETDSTPDFDGTIIPTQVYRAGSPLTLPAAEGGNPPLRYSITPDLPAGLSFNSNTRRISGTPRSASSDIYTYTVEDRNGDMAEVSFMLRVTEPPVRRPPPRPTPRPDNEAGGGGGCAISDQNDVVSDLLGVMACLVLISVSVVIRRKRRSYIKT